MITEIEKSSLIAIRDAKASDVPFIMATWLRGLKFGNSWFKLIDSDAFYKTYHDLISSLLIKPSVTIKVACLKEDDEVILGYSVYDDTILHWAHVKKAWRNIGIAKSLVPANITTVSHLTETGKSIFLKKKWIFNPFKLS